MDLNAIKAKLVETEMKVSGVVKAWQRVPDTVPDLPAFVNLTGKGTYEWLRMGAGLVRETRSFTIQLLIKDAGSHLGDGEIEAICEPYLARTIAAFAPGKLTMPQGWESLTHIESVILTEDSGMMFYGMDGVQIAGYEFKVTVTATYKI